MKITIVKNKYLNALFLLMLVSAIVHMLILVYITLRTGNLHLLNYFHILDVDYIIPNFLNSSWGDIISIIFVVIFYSLILKNNNRA